MQDLAMVMLSRRREASDSAKISDSHKKYTLRKQEETRLRRTKRHEWLVEDDEGKKKREWLHHSNG